MAEALRTTSDMTEQEKGKVPSRQNKRNKKLGKFSHPEAVRSCEAMESGSMVLEWQYKHAFTLPQRHPSQWTEAGREECWRADPVCQTSKLTHTNTVKPADQPEEQHAEAMMGWRQHMQTARLRIDPV